MTNTQALLRLAQNARTFAKCYVSLTEALLAEGVPEDKARQEARATAVMTSLVPIQSRGEACPVCGTHAP